MKIDTNKAQLRVIFSYSMLGNPRCVILQRTLQSEPTIEVTSVCNIRHLERDLPAG